MHVGSRLLPPALTVCALLADAGGLHGLAGWVVLIALPCAAAVAFLGISDLLEGKGRLAGVSSSIAAALLVLASTVRDHAPVGAHVPTLAVTALVAAVIVYAIPTVFWVLEPLRAPRSVTRLRTEP
jgi:hypothetical protein